MNYLTHIYLSGENEKVLVGNFIGDYVKGKNFEKFPENIQCGILLHRQIDTFTDSHPKFIEAKRKLRDDFGLYSGIIVDFFTHEVRKHPVRKRILNLQKPVPNHSSRLPVDRTLQKMVSPPIPDRVPAKNSK